MKIVVIGGTGLIGTKLINKLKEKGHDAIAASPSTGVNTITNEGLDKVLADAEVVVDVSNAPSWEDKAVLEFFETSTRNIIRAEKAAKVKYHVALSVVGTDILTESGYFKAKLAQERLIESSKIPYTIVRATQFFEFIQSIIHESTEGQTVHVSNAFIQPIAADDVADGLLQQVLAHPKNGIVDLAGPERYRFADIVAIYLKATHDPRKIVADTDGHYYGMKLKETELVPQKEAELGTITFEKWFSSQRQKAAAQHR